MSIDNLPKPYETFMQRFPDVWKAYNEMGQAAHAEGPLDQKARELIKLAIAVSARYEGAVHSATRKALAAGATTEEIYQVLLLALPTVGFPTTVAAMTWVDDILENAKLARQWP